MNKMKKHIASAMLMSVTAGSTLLAHAAPERLFLQQVSTDGAIVKWRGGDADRVCVSKTLKKLEKDLQKGGKGNKPACFNATETAGGHREAQLSGLSRNKTYFYSIGDMTDPGQQFKTAPKSGKPPKDGNTHILIVGDSGTQNELDEEGGLEHDGEAAQVLAGFYTYNANNGNEPVDLFLALGDNAYVAGTDAQWQTGFFDIYPDILKSAAVLTTIGNHEMGYGPLDLCFVAPVPCGALPPLVLAGGSASSDPASYSGDGDLIPDGTGTPYLDIFSQPAGGESGGVPSGTEQYYSVDYGNVHIVSLDSQLTARDEVARDSMRHWLIADLSSNTGDWTIVIFHHPPYTKGANHDSDDTEFSPIDRPEWDMRNEFTGIFEAYGVDVVYGGHSHSYERSYYLRGHTGISDTFDPAVHAELNAANEPSLGFGDDTYEQQSPTSGGIDDRVVYTVAGSSGKADDGGGFTTTDEEWLRHPAHIVQAADTECASAEGCRNGLAVKGSVVIDAGKKSLSAKFVDINGAVLDQFTITR